MTKKIPPIPGLALPQFMGAGERGDIALVGLPYDSTCSLKPGARFGPMAIRQYSSGVEGYSPRFQKSIEEDIAFRDLGDVQCGTGNPLPAIGRMEVVAREVIRRGHRILGIGGEHLVSLPLVRTAAEVAPAPLTVLHFDAHADVREEYEGEKHSHATVMRRIAELKRVERIAQIGIRSGCREEWDFREQSKKIIPIIDLDHFAKFLDTVSGPLYLTIDLDVLDPSIMPGTGTPEPGGMQFNELLRYVYSLEGRLLIGADVVELSPPYDPSLISAMTAIKLIREIILLMAGSRQSRRGG